MGPPITGQQAWMAGAWGHPGPPPVLQGSAVCNGNTAKEMTEKSLFDSFRSFFAYRRIGLGGAYAAALESAVRMCAFAANPSATPLSSARLGAIRSTGIFD